MGKSLANRFLIVAAEPGAPRRTFDAVAQLPHVNLQLADGAAQGITVHAEFARGPALISSVLLQHGEDKPFLEFAYGLGVKNIALVHLKDKGFELIFHGISLSGYNTASPGGSQYEIACCYKTFA